MIIEDIKTIAGFIKEMKNEGNECDATVSWSSSNDSIGHPWLGEKVLIRTESAGVHYGALNYVNGSTVRLKNARRIWRWDGAFTLNEIAVNGLEKPEGCKFSAPVSDIELDRIEIILVEAKGIESIESIKPHEI